MIIQLWNSLKSAWSRVNDRIMVNAARAPIPVFTTPEAVASYLMKHAIYTGDPMGGAADFNLNPQRLQAAILAGPDAVRRLAIDCDDYGTYAFQALLTIPGCIPSLYTLRDGAGWGHHVVCAYSLNGRVGVIDTNGHRDLPGGMASLCDVFSALYAARGYRYVEAVPTPYPF